MSLKGNFARKFFFFSQDSVAILRICYTGRFTAKCSSATQLCKRDPGVGNGRVTRDVFWRNRGRKVYTKGVAQKIDNTYVTRNTEFVTCSRKF